MNKKLLSLAVAAALVAPAAAMAEATLYGKMNVSIDYVDVNNVVLPTYNMTNDPVRIPGPLGLASVIVPPGGVIEQGQDFKGWGMNNGYVPSSVVYTVVPRTITIPGVGTIPTPGWPGGYTYRSSGGGRANRLGVKGSEDLGGGLKAIYQIEFGINPDDTNNNVVSNSDSITYRNTFVGLAGGFGTALVGRHDTPLKISTGKLDLFADTLADMSGTVGFQDLRADNVFAYISPSFSGFTFAGAIVPTGGSTGFGQLNDQADAINQAWSLAGIYSNGPFYASAAYESLGYELFNSNDSNTSCAPVLVGDYGGCTNHSSDQTQYRFGLGLLDWNGFTLTGIYAHMDHLAGNDAFLTGPGDALDGGMPAIPYNWYLPVGPDQMDLWQISAGYSFGNAMVKAMYGQSTFDTDYVENLGSSALTKQKNNDLLNGDRSTWAVGVDYNFSKRTKAYALYTSVTDDREDWIAGSQWDGFSLGMMHSF
jgi:predicted porin